MNGIAYIALSTLLPLFIGYIASKKMSSKGASATPVLSESSVWILCFPILTIIFFVSIVFNQHFHDKYPILTFCPFIFISSTIIGFIKWTQAQGKYFILIKLACVTTIAFASCAIFLPEAYNNRGALLVLAAYFLGLVFGLLLLRRLKRV